MRTRLARSSGSTARPTRYARSTRGATKSASTGRTSTGKPFGGFDALAQTLAARDRALRFAMNAGMFEADQSPVGLFVEDGKRKHRADTREGGSNFHLKPNGIFWIGDGAAGVMETTRYLANPPPARFATQSGPMLVIDGHIHPKIQPTGTSEKIRNGVCVRDGATAIFAISDEPVTFHAFARLFLDALHCTDALFLDGSVSSLYAPDLERDDEFHPARTDRRRHRAGAVRASSQAKQSPKFRPAGFVDDDQFGMPSSP